jgi:hypothetical protein
MNPGHQLRVTLGVRTFEEQLRSWNRVRSVRDAGTEVVDTSLIILADSLYPHTPDSAALARFNSFYESYELINTPTVAVPGLSEHGQLRAFDFRIHRGRRLIAGTTTATAARAWDSTGWTCRLALAVCGQSDRFMGPLLDPYEPWHYRYVRE